jgi:uracil-DNA glycosylase family 4
MLIGEQPGDQEDLAGRPFVCPAGKLLDKALAEAVDRKQVWHQRGRAPAGSPRARMHKTPTQQGGRRSPGLAAPELRLVKPSIIVCLGATAAKRCSGSSNRDCRRGRWLESDLAEHVMVTVHPSPIPQPREDSTTPTRRWSGTSSSSPPSADRNRRLCHGRIGRHANLRAVHDSIRLTPSAARTYIKIGRARLGSPAARGDYGYGTASAAGGRHKRHKTANKPRLPATPANPGAVFR